MNAMTHGDRPKAHGVLGPALGGASGLLFGVAVFVFSHNVLIALACAVPLGVTLGVALTEREGSTDSGRNARRWLAWTLLVGVLALLGLGLWAA